MGSDPLADLSRDDLVALWERRATRARFRGDLARFIIEFDLGSTLYEIGRDLRWTDARVAAAWAALLDMARSELRQGGPLT